jgi:magnesium transporter
VRLFRVRRKPAGLAPGTPVFVGEQRVERPRISVFDYDDNRCEERELSSVADCRPLRESPTVTWLNVDGVHDTALVERLGECFGLHPLVVEDVVNTTQRPKLEDYGDYIYIVVRMFRRGPDGELLSEQVSLVLGPNFVLSFQEAPGDVFDPVRARLREHKGRLRKLGPDYLLYALLDAVVDHLFTVLEPVGDRIEDLEEILVARPGPEALHTIHALKRELVHLRKSVWPLREVVSGLERLESKLVRKTTGVFLRDVYDHTIQVIDVVETFRDTVGGMLDVYLSSISNRMNEVMKVLTIIATIFIPLTFIAGIYGMNFRNMPELGWPWAYFAVLGLMAAVALAMLVYFKRKKWL